MTSSGMGFRPEEKGIKTVGWKGALPPRRMGFRPEEKGIKTFAAHPTPNTVDGWDSDLKKKGLRQGDAENGCGRLMGWDSDLKKKGLRLT